MPRVGSHLKCKRCGRARHRNTANGLCGRCWGEVGRPALVAERQAIKARRAAKRAAPYDPLASISESDIEAAFIRSAPDPIAAVLADDVRDYIFDQEPEVALAMIDQASDELANEGTPMPTTRGRKPNLTPEVKKEIAEAYAIGEPIAEILRTYAIGQGALYRILHAAGVALRGQNNGIVDSPADVKPPELVPPPPLTIEPGVFVPSVQRWVVTYEVVRRESTTVAASSYTEAAAQVEGEGVVITKVERL